MSKFTKEQAEAIVDVYVESKDAGDDYKARTEVVKTLAANYKVSEPVIRGTLVAADVYKKKEVAAKSATSGTNKEDLAKAIEASFGVEMKSLRNMTVKDLKAFWGKIVEMSDIMENA